MIAAITEDLPMYTTNRPVPGPAALAVPAVHDRGLVRAGPGSASQDGTHGLRGHGAQPGP